MYDFEWHKIHAEKTKSSAEVVLRHVREFFPYASMIDVGCGDGIWLKASRDLGCPVNRGVDGPWTDLSRILIPREDLAIHELTRSFALGTFDIAVSLEVAEHVDGRFSDVYVDNLVAHSDFVLFGAAIPYQGGFRHINERWQSFWQGKFAERGYACFDVLRDLIWNRDDIHFWYKQNMLVYINGQRDDLKRMVETYIAEKGINRYPIDLVHPEKYEALASYREIAFKPLLRNLPIQSARKLKRIVLRQT